MKADGITSRSLLLAGLLALAGGMTTTMISCQPPAAPPATAPALTRPATEVEPLWKIRSARRQATYAEMKMPVVTKGMRLQIGMPTGPSPWQGNPLSLFSTRVHRSFVEGPLVDQLTGSPRAGSDSGSYLMPLAEQPGEGGARSFEVNDPFPLYMKVEVGAAQDPGTYRFPVTILTPGKAAFESAIDVDVSEIALPTEQRVLACITTTTSDLAKIFPQTFGMINGVYLDRAGTEDAAAVAQLDALVKAAQRNGVALFVEDLAPHVKVDNVGAVSVDWDAYDRVMQPYMDGTAFPDRVPLQVWLAPVPPRRLRNSPTQLRQYVAACADHFAAKGWVATPAFLHPALVEDEVDEKLRAEIGQVLKLHMTRDMLAVSNPDAAVPQARLWVVDDSDPRLPPAGALANEHSVRSWPWVCAARAGTMAAPGVKGFVWRHAVTKVGQSSDDVGWGLLEVGAANAGDQPVFPALRLAWLNQGLNDTALLGLLEKRSDPMLVHEVLGGMVGRTGIKVTARLSGEMPTAAAGYLYAGWPVDRATWATLPDMLEKLVLANEPGQRVIVAPGDPLYIAAKLWLARAHRPVARVAGYRFGFRNGEEGIIVDAAADLLIENPVDVPVDMEARLANLPGDFDIVPAVNQPKGERDMKVAAYGMDRLLLPVAGHLDSLLEGPRISNLQLSERAGGSILRLPVQLPIYRMKAAANPPRIDGRSDDWPMDAQTRSFGTMSVAMRYLSRPDLLTGAPRRDDEPAIVRWSFDNDNIYVLVRCPQALVSDERNTDWPEHDNAAGDSARWWGTDGLQLQFTTLSPARAGAEKGAAKVFDIAFKPGGVMMVRQAQLKGPTLSKWTDGPTGVNYGIQIEKDQGRVAGYTVEAAIPRKWFAGGENIPNVPGPVLRVNVLRHRASDLASTSWSGPLVNDDDVSMMGLLVGNP
jgi:hypothetical protein